MTLSWSPLYVNTKLGTKIMTIGWTWMSNVSIPPNGHHLWRFYTSLKNIANNLLDQTTCSNMIKKSDSLALGRHRYKHLANIKASSPKPRRSSSCWQPRLVSSELVDPLCAKLTIYELLHYTPFSSVSYGLPDQAKVKIE